jgi:hypothetical protein
VQLSELQPRLKDADAVIARVSFAQRWQDQDPKFLACLRHLTDVFPDDAQVWATRVNLKDDGTGSMEFQATSEPVATAALRRIQQSPYFKDVKVVTTGAAGRNSRDQSSTVTFRFTPAAPPPPAPGGTGGAAGASVNTGSGSALDKAGTPSSPAAGAATTNPTTGPAAATTAPRASETNGDSNGRRRRRGNDSRGNR